MVSTPIDLSGGGGIRAWRLALRDEFEKVLYGVEGDAQEGQEDLAKVTPPIRLSPVVGWNNMCTGALAEVYSEFTYR